jgi:hypothetical protein
LNRLRLAPPEIGHGLSHGRTERLKVGAARAVQVGRKSTLELLPLFARHAKLLVALASLLHHRILVLGL